MATPYELSDINIFFGYGSLDLELETEHDINWGLMQPRNSMFYDRRDAAGIVDYENWPSALWLLVLLKYEIMAWNAYRNNVVGDGVDGRKERRVAMSQDYISIEADGPELNIDVEYIPYTKTRPKNVTMPIGIMT